MPFLPRAGQASATCDGYIFASLLTGFEGIGLEVPEVAEELLPRRSGNPAVHERRTQETGLLAQIAHDGGLVTCWSGQGSVGNSSSMG